jgi:TonB family protein
VDSVSLLRRLDDRLDQSAEDAMQKWQFEPALRDGQPIDVDALIEIPFRLAPKTAK